MGPLLVQCRPVQIKRLSEQRIYNLRATKRQQFCPEHLPPDGAGPSTTIALVRKLRKALTDEEVAPVQGQLLLRVASKEGQRSIIYQSFHLLKNSTQFVGESKALTQPCFQSCFH
ncbi:hypothetical protein T4C_13862 [Trichinella pseudospiralis]|uniref:Uncharacterized protein n=1 Tax=Trichinella pseudospiralis TaxID=6337 RepID=A0A0V1IPG0_TRIPS|nr:hypothetical protein T4C_13862 [Trichinella pseudospiralis]